MSAVDALNAFVSTMEAIGGAKGWRYPSNAPAANPMNILEDHGLRLITLPL